MNQPCISGFFLGVFLLLLTFPALAQEEQDLHSFNPNRSLEKTYWLSTVPGVSQTNVLFFDSDSMYVAENFEDVFIPNKRYRQSGDSIQFQYLHEYLCDDFPWGTYRYEVIDDSMHFELIEDNNCARRAWELPQHIYVFIKYAEPLIIDETEEAPAQVTNEDYVFYPNPSPDGIFYYENYTYERPRYIVYNFRGQEVKSGRVHVKGQVNLDDLDNGIYFLTVLATHGWQTFRLVK